MRSNSGGAFKPPSKLLAAEKTVDVIRREFWADDSRAPIERSAAMSATEAPV
jgi:hypothetical protein